MTALLDLQGVTAGYGPVQALFDVDLHLTDGEVMALMGRNGMGKTTIRTIMRLLPLTGGMLFFDGRDMARLPAHRAARAGLGLVPEGRRCFAPLTVAENLSVAQRPGDWTLARVCDLFPRLGERMGQAARTLSGGEQQMLAIGRALKGQGMSILLVDKSLAELRAVADRAVILERGASVWSGRMARLDDDTAQRLLGV